MKNNNEIYEDNRVILTLEQLEEARNNPDLYGPGSYVVYEDHAVFHRFLEDDDIFDDEEYEELVREWERKVELERSMK